MKKSKKEEIKFYSLDNILKENCDYNIIIGERSNGDKIYRASSNLTGSSNVMTFGNGKWSY